MKNIKDAIAEENSASTYEVSATVEQTASAEEIFNASELSELAQILQSTIKKFKV